MQKFTLTTKTLPGLSGLAWDFGNFFRDRLGITMLSDLLIGRTLKSIYPFRPYFGYVTFLTA